MNRLPSPPGSVCDNSAREMTGAAGALECGSLLPLFSSELARAAVDRTPSGDGQQAGREESGSKLPHSKASHDK